MRKISLSIVLLVIGLGCANNKADDPPQIVGRSNTLPDFVALAKDLQPVVVNISTTPMPRGAAPGFEGPPQAEEDRDPSDSGDEDSPNRFFGRRGPPAGQQRNLGSGFIIESNGAILTNAHVVDNAKRILVRLADKREFEAKLLGKDPKTDIAIIKIDSKESLPKVRLGDSDRLQVGEWVMAVGNPFGLDSTVTSGIVSAKGRHIGAGPYDDFIQTDASVNPGNSGGPLVNGRGEVVGINLAIVSQTGTNTGIAFATPINLVKELLPELERKGKVTRGWAGLAIQEVTPEIAAALGLDNPAGALVAAVVKDGPAERGGVKVGDIITEYDGREIKTASEFPLIVARTPVDKNVRIKVVRDQRELAMNITVGKMNEAETGGAGKG